MSVSIDEALEVVDGEDNGNFIVMGDIAKRMKCCSGIAAYKSDMKWTVLGYFTMLKCIYGALYCCTHRTFVAVNSHITIFTP